MKRNIIKLCTLVLLSTSLFACEKDYGINLGPMEDSVSPIPVTVTNASGFERFPIVNTSVASGGNITIELQIPADKGRIKQVTRIVTGPATTINLTNLNATTGVDRNYGGTVTGAGTNKITFTTSIADYLTYRLRVGASAGVAGPAATTGGPVTAPVPSITTVPTDIGFYFRLELEDGTSIVPFPVRVRVLP